MNIDVVNSHHHSQQQNNLEATSSLTTALSDNKLEILFIDTFSSNNIEELALDDSFSKKSEPSIGLVQFSRPVIIYEVRIIPLSTLVSWTSSLGSGPHKEDFRLGGTLPSSFEIHFYVNDLKAKESSTFLDIGCFIYKEHENVIFRPPVLIATDGLFLRGHFQCVTVAVLGHATDLTKLLLNEELSSSSQIEIADEEVDNEIDENSVSHRDNFIVDIKEPDDLNDDDEYNQAINLTNSLKNNSLEDFLSNNIDEEDCDDELNRRLASKQSPENFVVLKEEVHSLSPTSSPENNSINRIFSPSSSPHRLQQQYYSRSQTPKSNCSNLSYSRHDSRYQSQKGSKNFEIDDVNKQKYSSPPHQSSSSLFTSSKNNSSAHSSLKSRIHLPSGSSSTTSSKNTYSKHLHSTFEDERAKIDHNNDERKSRRHNDSSSHYHNDHRNRYNDSTNNNYDEYYDSKRSSHSHRSLERDSSLRRHQTSSTSSSQYQKQTRLFDREGGRSRSRSIESNSRSSSQSHHRLSTNKQPRSSANLDNLKVSHESRHHLRNVYQDENHQRFNSKSRSQRYENQNDDVRHSSSSKSKNSSSSYMNVTSRTQKSRESRSLSLSSSSSRLETRKRDYHSSIRDSSRSRDSINGDHQDQGPKISSQSPENKKSRYDYHQKTSIQLVSSSNSLKGNNYRSSTRKNQKSFTTTSTNCATRTASSLKVSSDELEIATCGETVASSSQQVDINDQTMSPFISSISNVSSSDEVDSLEIENDEFNSKTKNQNGQEIEDAVEKNFSIDCENRNVGEQNTEDVDKDKKLNLEDVEFYEPLSPFDDNELFNDENEENKNEIISDQVVDDNSEDNFEQISTSSDVDIIEDEEKFENEISSAGKNRKAELEVISSDEDEANEDFVTDKTERNYFECCAGKFEDEEIDISIFDFKQNYFDPFNIDQLEALKFPFNNNAMTNFYDLKLFTKIMSFIDQNFFSIYGFTDWLYASEVSSIAENPTRKEQIQENWVQNVEQLASDIMQLSCPIYYSFDSAIDRTDCSNQSKSIYSKKDLDRLISVLISITKDGLDFHLALSQKLIPYKVRHLKAGIKLLIALFSSFDLRLNEGLVPASSQNNQKLIDLLFDADLPFYLLKLYNKPLMSLSLKLLILNGLIVICDYSEGVEYLFNKFFDWPSELLLDVNDELLLNDNNSQEKSLPNSEHSQPQKLTCYQFILKLVISTRQNTRLTSVYEEILEKVHLYELFASISDLPSVDIENSMCNKGSPPTSELDVQALLVQMIESFDRLSNKIHRPLRLLPSISLYEMKTAVYSSASLILLSQTTASRTPSLSSGLDDSNIDNLSSYNFIEPRLICKYVSCSSSKIGFFGPKAFYRFFKHFNVFGTIIDLLKKLKYFFLRQNNVERTATAQQALNKASESLCDILIRLLDLITTHQQGLKFFFEDQCNIDYANIIHSILIDFPLTSSPTENSHITNKIIHFGVQFITRLYTFNLIDKILYGVHQKNNMKNEIFSNDNIPLILESLFKLFTMVNMEKSALRRTVISVLTMEHNFDAIYAFILPFLTQQLINTQEVSQSESKFASIDPIAFIYASKLAIDCVQYLPERNFLHFIDIYGESLLKNVENVQSFFQQKHNSKLFHHNSIIRSSLFRNQLLKYSNLSSWLAPLKFQVTCTTKNVSFNSHEELNIRKFVTILKKHHDACREKFNLVDNYVYRTFFMDPEIVTSIKILVSLSDPSSDYRKNQDPDIQMKYKYSLVTCHYYDCMSYLFTLLEAITETCGRPSHQNSAVTFNDFYTSSFLKSSLKQQQSTTISSADQQTQSNNKQSLQQHGVSILNQGSLVIEFIRPSVRLLKLILKYLTDSIGHRFNDSTSIPILLKIYGLMNHFKHSNLAESNEFSERSLNFEGKSGTALDAMLIQDEIIEILVSIFTGVYLEHSQSEATLEKSVWTMMLKHLFDFVSLAPKCFVPGLEIFSRILPETLPFAKSFCENFTQDDSLFIINYRKFWSAHLHCVNEDIELMFSSLVLSDCYQVQHILRNVFYKMCDLYSTTVLTISKSVTEFLVQNLSESLEAKASLMKDSLDEKCSNQEYFFGNCVKILDFILDLFRFSIAFRIGILNALGCFAFSLEKEIAVGSSSSVNQNKDSKIHKFFGKIFETLNQRKFDLNVRLPSTFNFLSIVLSENCEISNSESPIVILNKFFDANDYIPSLKTFKFCDNLTSKFFISCSQPLNQYFDERIINCQVDSQLDFVNNVTFSNSILEDSKDNKEFCEENMNKPIPASNDQKSFVVYCSEFQKLSAYQRMPKEWATLTKKKSDELFQLESLSVKTNLLSLIKKYFNLDFHAWFKLMEVFYSPIVESPENKSPEKNNEGTNKQVFPSSSMNHKRNPLRGRSGRMGYHRGDSFRSRPPNTSRPPSMHVDDFVALEQRKDPMIGGNKLNMRSSSSMNHHHHSAPGHSNSGLLTSGSTHSYVLKPDYSMFRNKKNTSSTLTTSWSSSTSFIHNHSYSSNYKNDK